MKKIIGISFITLVLVLFTAFDHYRRAEKLVLKIIEPSVIQVDLNENKIIDAGETICVANIDSFTSNLSSDKDELISKMNFSKTDALSIGYLADEFAENTLFNKKVKLKFNGMKTQNCRYADVYLNKQNYSEFLQNEGFGIKDYKIINEESFKKQLNKAKKLKLVIFNHKSGKYHKLDCQYGLIAQDAVVILAQQLPKNAKDCKFCHINKKEKISKKQTTISSYPLSVTSGSIKLFLTDFTKVLKPNSRCDTQICNEFLNQINSAQSSIDMALYGWDKNGTLEKALISAKLRGVRIRLVYDETTNAKKFYKGTEGLAKIADISNCDLSATKSATNMLMHNKFVIIDNQKLITGSMNFSRTGFSGFNSNNLVIINSREIASKYNQEFEQMLSGKFHKNKIIMPAQTFFLGNTKITPLFSPKNVTTTSIIIPLINGAKQYIYMPTFLMTHTEMINSLIAAKKRGVDVRVINDAANSLNSNSKTKLLRDNGISVKVENYAGKMHMKTLIIDDKYIVIGSMNFSNSGEKKNDENTLIIEDIKLAKYYKGFFNYTWSKIPERYLKHNLRAESIYSIGSCTDGIDNNFDGKIDKDDDGCKLIPKSKF